MDTEKPIAPNSPEPDIPKTKPDHGELSTRAKTDVHATAKEQNAEPKGVPHSIPPHGAPPHGMPPHGKAPHSGMTRRQMIMHASMAALGLGIGSAGGFALGSHTATEKTLTATDVMKISYPFRGEHQSGILTPQQQQMHTAAYDMISDERDDLIDLLKRWSLAAERMMAGDLVGDPKTFKEVPPDDTGETMGLGPGALTITIGFGESLFVKDGVDRYDIADRLPEALVGGIPRMAAEKLDASKCYGDLVVQACAEDPMIAMHAIHNMTRIAFGTASVRWTQLGYGRTSSTSTGQQTPRNLFGFKDGTSNIKAEDEQSELNEHLWIQAGDDGGDWFSGGTYLCIRKIKQMMEVWDELVLSEQETIIGRDKLEGAPLSGGTEFSDPDFDKKDEDGEPLIAIDSHLAIVHPDHNNGRRMLRRGYNYMEGNDQLGRLEGGLFFIAFVRDPKTNFIPILRRMSDDQMTEYLQHIATAVFIIPPGMKETDDYIGQALFS